MTIDDIYFAAINGEKERLTELLEANEVDINQMLDGGMSNGVHTSFPVLFSIVSQMRQNGFDFEVLDILVKYGVNLNGVVVVASDAFTREIPIMSYAIRDWNTPQMVGYFLARGANPNHAQIEKYADGRKELYPLIYLTLEFREDHHVLSLLLRHGADPNARIFTYNHEQACPQILPLLFYAVVTRHSLEKTALLFSYGADPKAEVRVGYGRVREIDFDSYIRKSYSKLYRLFEQGYQQGRRNPMTPTPVDGEQFRLKREAPKPALTPESVPEAEPVQEDPLDKLRVLAMSLVDYDWKWKMSYFNALKASQIQPGLFGKGKKEQQEALGTLETIRNNRKVCLQELNAMDRKLTDGKMPRWWNSFDGLEYMPRFTGDIMVWIPFNRLAEAPDGLSITSICSYPEDTITQKEVDLLVKAGEIAPIYQSTPDPEGKYYVAELCMWSVKDAAYVYQTVTDTYNEQEIREAVRSRNESFNEGERFLNGICGNGFFTDEEQHLARKMSDSDYFNSQWNREQLIRRYQDRLRNAKTTHTHIKNRTMYEHWLRPVGIILFDQSFKNICTVMLYRQDRSAEIYLADSNKVIYDIRETPISGSYEKKRIHALRQLGGYPIQPADVLAPKPDYLSEEEWYEFVYNCYRAGSGEELSQAIDQAYVNAREHKKQVIQSTRWPGMGL